MSTLSQRDKKARTCTRETLVEGSADEINVVTHPLNVARADKFAFICALSCSGACE
jgi:hypothetical protein